MVSNIIVKIIFDFFFTEIKFHIFPFHKYPLRDGRVLHLSLVALNPLSVKIDNC